MPDDGLTLIAVDKGDMLSTESLRIDAAEEGAVMTSAHADLIVVRPRGYF